MRARTAQMRARTAWLRCSPARGPGCCRSSGDACFDVSITDAEDLVQDVFHNILRRADLIEQIENLTGYVYQSLANRIIDRRRMPSRDVPLSQDGSFSDDSLRRALEPVSPDLDLENC